MRSGVSRHYGPASPGQCTGCMACVDVCPHQALTSGLTEAMFRMPLRDAKKCTGCGLCEKICPVAQKISFQSPRKSELFAGWDDNATSRQKSSSGGVFAVLARAVLQQGGHVYGAAIDGMDVKVLAIDREEELPRLQGSKYAHADYSGAYNAVKMDLKNRIPVLFSGLSCQVAALRSFLGKGADDPLLYTVDLVCTGVPSLLPLKMIGRAAENGAEIEFFRSKENGWRPDYRLTIDVAGNRRTQKFSSFYYRSYGSARRTNCAPCPFAYRARKSDFTIGDLWGDQDFPQEHANGISAVIVHTEHGKALLAQTDGTFHGAKWGRFLVHNPRAYDAEIPAFHFRAFWKKAAFAYLRLGNALHFPPKTHGFTAQVLWLPLKLLQKFQLRKETSSETARRTEFLHEVKNNG